MGGIHYPAPVKLIAGMISGRKEIFKLARRKMEERLGAIDFISERIPFNFTCYYEEEFGKNLLREFVSFTTLIESDKLAEIKLFTNELEKHLSDLVTGNRLINIDPGYIAKGKLVLATTKDYQHRIYLEDGIYAEVTLRFKDGRFLPWEWTYPDYRNDAYLIIFNEIRKRYISELHCLQQKGD